MASAVIKSPDGNVRFLHQTPQAVRMARTLEESVNRVLMPDETWEEIDPKEIPEDRYFRDAWGVGKGKVKVSTAKAADIKMNRIRRARNAELQELDAVFNQIQEEFEIVRLDNDIYSEDMELVKYQLQAERAKPKDEQDPTEIEDCEAKVADIKTQQRKLRGRIKVLRAKLKEVAGKKQALRDIPQTVDLTKYDLARMAAFVPKELTHRTDVE